MIFLFIRQARVGNLINWNFEGKVGFVKDFLQRLWKLLRLKSTSTLELNAATQEYLSHLLQGFLEGESGEKDDLFYHLTVEIVEEMERLSLIAFEHRSEMIEGLQRHLIPAYYRLTSRLVNVNSYTETIKEEHADLFYLVKSFATFGRASRFYYTR